MSNRTRDIPAIDETPVDGTSGDTSTGPVLGIVASSHRLVRANGSLAAGRACAASVSAAARRVLPRIPRYVV